MRVRFLPGSPLLKGNIMKKFAIGLIAATSLLLASCGQPLNQDGKTYPTYGIANEQTSKSENICYEMSVPNVIVGIILVETFIVPIYIVGWDLYNPIGPKNVNGKCGIDA